MMYPLLLSRSLVPDSRRSRSASSANDVGDGTGIGVVMPADGTATRDPFEDEATDRLPPTVTGEVSGGGLGDDLLHHRKLGVLLSRSLHVRSQ